MCVHFFPPSFLGWGRAYIRNVIYYGLDSLFRCHCCQATPVVLIGFTAGSTSELCFQNRSMVYLCAKYACIDYIYLVLSVFLTRGDHIFFIPTHGAHVERTTIRPSRNLVHEVFERIQQPEKRREGTGVTETKQPEGHSIEGMPHGPPMACRVRATLFQSSREHRGRVSAPHAIGSSMDSRDLHTKYQIRHRTSYRRRSSSLFLPHLHANNERKRGIERDRRACSRLIETLSPTPKLLVPHV